MSSRWTADQMPDQSGRIALITGGNSGLGLEAAKQLAAKGARVVITARDMAKGEAALAEIRAHAPQASAELAQLDLASLDSIRAFADRFPSETAPDGLDLLINNAGLMAPPRRTTADGFELQLGTNHLGHFALTGRLLSTLTARPGARVVTVSSGAHRMGRIDFDDLQGERRYRRWRAYGQSKLANLLFAFELDRRLREAGAPVASVAAHPGYAATNLQSAAAPRLDRLVMVVSNRVIAQSAAMGTLPILYAATEPDLPGGSFAGPDGPGEQRGHPTVVRARATAYDTGVARRLWEVSEQLTGVRYELPAPAAAA
jgi:NAD(P)-dependent dehydrogenase (short-subunit alcohol dehydrogenase family)